MEICPLSRSKSGARAQARKRKMKNGIKCILAAIGLLEPARRILQRLGVVRGHGHQLLIKHLCKERSLLRTSFVGRRLIEVGSTREELAGQDSTTCLAAFCADTGLTFATVDMDPENTRRAKETLARYNQDFEAVNGQGEDFLRETSDTIHYCYLDAFDIDHGGHSATRKRSYKQYLGVSISNELCSKMHLDCAKSLAVKMAVGGIVVFDDCWREGTEWYGKGRSAVPFLLNNGFVTIEAAKNSVALKRAR